MDPNVESIFQTIEKKTKEQDTFDEEQEDNDEEKFFDEPGFPAEFGKYTVYGYEKIEN